MAPSSCACVGGCKSLRVCEFLATKLSDEVAFGIPWDPVKFLTKVGEVGHPHSFVKVLPQEMEQAISTFFCSMLLG